MQYQYLESGNMGKEFFLRKGSQLIIPSAIKIALKYANFSSLIKKIPSKGKVRSLLTLQSLIILPKLKKKGQEISNLNDDLLELF